MIGNNKSATINELVLNSIAQAKSDGLDTTKVEEAFDVKTDTETDTKSEEPTAPVAPAKLEVTEPPVTQPVAPEVPTAPATPAPTDPVQQTNSAPAPVAPTVPAAEPVPPINQEQDMKYVTHKNGRGFPIAVKYKNAAGDEVETELADGATVDVAEDQSEAVAKQLADAKAPEVDVNAVVEAAVNAATKPLAEALERIEKQAFNKGAKEPGFQPEKTPVAEHSVTRTGIKLDTMSWKERGGLQVELAWQAFKGGNVDAMRDLREVNAYHLDKLKEADKVVNSIGLGDLGNFVISPELLGQIQGARTNYTPLINATQWQDTVSLQMAWIERQGDISMQPVALDADTTVNGNLKPISTYGTNIQTAALEELAAVTPVVNAATRFLAADLLGDVATGYRNDFDRKRAQLVIARLEQAVELSGRSVAYLRDTPVDSLITLSQAWAQIANTTPNGTFLLGVSSYAEIMGQIMRSGSNGPLSQILTSGDTPSFFGRPYIIVADDLLPTLNSTGTRTFLVNGQSVVVSHAIFYADLANFTGRTSGGLMYDLSTEAAYEEGGVTKSAYQRNELVMRGSFFRGGAIKDYTQVAGINSIGVS